MKSYQHSRQDYRPNDGGALINAVRPGRCYISEIVVNPLTFRIAHSARQNPLRTLGNVDVSYTKMTIRVPTPELDSNIFERNRI
jgi:hypothetical protein